MQDTRIDTYSAEESLERARSRVGEKRYSVVLNNCEHCVNWLKTDTAQSHQTQVGAQAVLKGVASGGRLGRRMNWLAGDCWWAWEQQQWTTLNHRMIRNTES